MTIAGVLALLGIGVLVYFIHHIASSLQASTIIASVGNETLETIDGLVGSSNEPEAAERVSAEVAADDPRECTEITATCHGYLATVDVRRFVKLAAESRAVVQFTLRFGDFAHFGDTVAKVRSERTLTPRMVEQMQAAIGLADRRSNQQDPGFGLQQLTDIALKALSPGVNDPTTALMSLNYIGAIVQKLAHQQIRPQVFCDEQGRPRLHIPYPDFDEYVEASLSPIRAAAATNLGVLRSLVMSIDRARKVTTHEQPLRSLLRLLEQLARASRVLNEQDDRHALDTSIEAVRSGLVQALQAKE